jgi:hypothetical protein
MEWPMDDENKLEFALKSKGKPRKSPLSIGILDGICSLYLSDMAQMHYQYANLLFLT